MLRHQPTRRRGEKEPLLAYSIATVLVLLVTAVVPGALLFLASYQLHARSYIKNSQFIFAQRLSERNDRLYDRYLATSDGKERPGRRAATQVGLMYDLDLYVDFLYDTSIAKASSRPVGAGGAQAVHGPTRCHGMRSTTWCCRSSKTIFRTIWRHRSSGGSYCTTVLTTIAGTRETDRGLGAAEIVFTARTLSLPVALTSLVPSIMRVSPSRATPADLERPDEGLVQPRQSEALPTTGSTEVPDGEPRRQPHVVRHARFDSAPPFGGSGSVDPVLDRDPDLEPADLSGRNSPSLCGVAVRWLRTRGRTLLAICDKASMTDRLTGMTPLKLGPIVRSSDITGAWQRALLDVDERSEHRAVLIDDFDEGLEDAAAMVSQTRAARRVRFGSLQNGDSAVAGVHTRPDGQRAVIVCAARRSAGRQGHAAAGQTPSATEASEMPLERWRRILRAFVVVEWREDDEDDKEGARKDPGVPDAERRSPAASEPPPASDAERRPPAEQALARSIR